MAENPIVMEQVVAAGDADALVGRRPQTAAAERCRLERLADLVARGYLRARELDPLLGSATAIASALQARRLCLVCGLELPGPGRLPVHPDCVGGHRRPLPEADLALAGGRLEQLADEIAGCRVVYQGSRARDGRLALLRTEGHRVAEVPAIAVFAPPLQATGRARAGGLGVGYRGAGPVDLAITMLADVAGLRHRGDDAAGAVAWSTWRQVLPLVAALPRLGPWQLPARAVLSAVAG